ncbi:MAG: lipid-A-disaccharide synthase [Pseudanabaenaceae cyanobacterium bins.39]|nr:lipid-A-disaccharide synthase [Pseudanabaenaceae cyanobacterium bins.39]
MAINSEQISENVNPSPLIDILILSNGPGELTTWVYPFLKVFKANQQVQDYRISIALSPCQNASGQEAELAMSFPDVSRVLPQEQFFDFLLWGKTPQWDWSNQGIVVFLGGDQFFAVAIAKRLGYRTVIYAEWEARWHRWVDYFAVRNQAIADRLAPSLRHKAIVIGDLMVDRIDEQPEPTNQVSNIDNQLICFMPGSKAHKLKIGVPLVIAIADILKQKRPQLEMAIALAPTTTPAAIATYAQIPFPAPESTNAIATLQNNQLITNTGSVIQIHQEFPAHQLIKRSQICVTTVGANTAELASLHQPMIVLLPTNFSDLKVGWDGILGILAAAPLLGKFLSQIINSVLINQIQKRGQLLAWPNIWAKQAIVPELLGVLSPNQIAEQIIDYLDHPDKLATMKAQLQQVCGSSGAATKLAQIIQEIAIPMLKQR